MPSLFTSDAPGRDAAGSASARTLVLKTCPATGAVNVYRAAEPHLAIGTIFASPRRRYNWWCHTALGGAGHGEAVNLDDARACLAAELERTSPPTRH
jgi:hypothetical protein